MILELTTKLNKCYSDKIYLKKEIKKIKSQIKSNPNNEDLIELLIDYNKTLVKNDFCIDSLKRGLNILFVSRDETTKREIKRNKKQKQLKTI